MSNSKDHFFLGLPMCVCILTVYFSYITMVGSSKITYEGESLCGVRVQRRIRQNVTGRQRVFLLLFSLSPLTHRYVTYRYQVPGTYVLISKFLLLVYF
jgi:hypothetical protein